MMTNLRVNRIPSMPKSPLLFGLESRPRAPPEVPAGQMYLQKPGSAVSCFTPYQRGIATTKTTRSTYFSHVKARVIRLLRIFGVGILCSSS